MSRRPRRTITITTGPSIDPVVLADAKAWAKIDDSTDDAQVTALITAARMACEEHLRRTLINTSYKLTLDLVDSGYDLGEGTYDLPLSALYGALPPAVELPKGPIASITSVVTYALDNSSSTYANTNYYLDTAGQRLVLNIGSIWPSNLRPIAAVEITYVAGYGAAAANVPQPILNGIMIHVASLYEQRGQSIDAMAIPPGAKQLYSSYRILGERLG